MAALELFHTPVALMDGLGPEEARRLSLLFSRRTYSPGTDVIRQGEPCHHLFVVESGSLIVHTFQRGVLARLGPGGCVGEVTLFTDAEASATVTAATEAALWAAPHAEMRGFIEECPALARNFCRLLSGRLFASSQKAEHRGVTLLVDLSEEIGPGVATNLAASLAYHLQQEVALVDLSSPAKGERITSPPVMERSLEGLVIWRWEGREAGQLPFWLEELTRQHPHVVAWAPGRTAEQMAPLLGMADRVLVMVSHQNCRRTEYRPWLSADSAATELVVVETSEPRSPAATEAIEGDTGLTVGGLLPVAPAALRSPTVAPDWVLRHPEEAFARSIARLARRLVGKRVGVALGAGAGRGFAHLWVLRALERLGVHPDVIVGTSIGAAVAGFYASAVSYEDIEERMVAFGRSPRRWSLPVYSFVAGTALDRQFHRNSLIARAALDRAYGHTGSDASTELRIEDFLLPCAFVAADLLTGEEVVIRRGLAWQAGRASGTMPGIFPPMRLDRRLLIDGGVVNPIPCRVARELGADIVLGVSLEVAPAPEGQCKAVPQTRSRRRTPTWPEVLLRSYDLIQRSLTRQCLAEGDVAIRVFTPPMELMNFRGGPHFVEAGERAVEAAQEQLVALLPWVRSN